MSASSFRVRIRVTRPGYVPDVRDRWADTVFWIGWCAAGALLVAVGTKQWFVRDDWAFVITRQAAKAGGGTDWLLFAQDGHWMTVPILIWDLTMRWFGLGSYLPYLLPVIAAYLGCVLLVRVLCRRAGVSPWTTTIVCVLLAAFGTGWENLVFAIQITYMLSLLAFLGQLLLVDHDGALDWRDGIGAALALVGVMSSGFGIVFVGGVALVLIARRRWMALVGLVPAALALTWWFVAHGEDGAAAAAPGSKLQVPRFAAYGIYGTFRGIAGIGVLAIIGLLGCMAAGVWLLRRPSVNAPVLGCAATAVVMFVGVGWERVGFGMEVASSSRYTGVAAVLLAPLLAVGVDQLARFGPIALAVGRVVLISSIAINAARMWTDGSRWAELAASDRTTFELVAGSPRLAEADLDWHGITPNNPDVGVSDLGRLVELGAFVPREPDTPAEHELVDRALGLAPAGN